MTLIIDNPTVEKVLNPSEVNDALELAALELATGGAINAPPYRVFTPRDPDDYRDHPRFPEGGGNPTHHSYTSLSGAICQTGCHNGPHRLRHHHLFRTGRKNASKAGAGPQGRKVLRPHLSLQLSHRRAPGHHSRRLSSEVPGSGHGSGGSEIPGSKGFAYGGVDRNRLAGPGRRSLFRRPRQPGKDPRLQPHSRQEGDVRGPYVHGGRNRNHSGSFRPRGLFAARISSTWRPTPRIRW